MVAELVKASVYQLKGRGFESRRRHSYLFSRLANYKCAWPCADKNAHAQARTNSKWLNSFVHATSIFGMTSYVKYDVKVSQSTTSTSLWKEKQGLHICGSFRTTNGVLNSMTWRGSCGVISIGEVCGCEMMNTKIVEAWAQLSYWTCTWRQMETTKKYNL